MTLPNAQTIVRATILTAVSLVIIRLAKPYLPTPVQNLLP